VLLAAERRFQDARDDRAHARSCRLFRCSDGGNRPARRATEIARYSEHARV